ncbi:MAG: PAS domain-containing sensor histidine kinase, partial [Candidatus Omnitrophota bacterium]
SLVTKRTAELEKANKALESELEWHMNAEENLSVTSQQWQKTFNAISDLISIQDKNFKLVQVNKAYADLFKMKPGELVGRTCYPIVHGTTEPCLNCPQKRTLETKKTQRLEYFEPRFNMHLEVMTYPIFDSNNDVAGTVHIIKDITERKHAEHVLKEAAELKTHFTSMVSHELRTPLTAIKEGISIVLDETTGALNSEQKDFLEISKRNVDRLARLINDVLDYQKLETGKFEFELKENDMNDVIKEVQKTMIAVAKNKGLDIVLRLEDGLPKFKFDRDKIVQVLTNLISNAIKFTDKGKITVTSSKGGGIVQVAVSDTGPGIEKNDLPKLFRAFEQLEKGKDRRTGGTGLGLTISKEIIEKHGGAIWAESERGQGSTFNFTLPYSRSGGAI